MTILNNNLLTALKSAKPKELKFVASILDRSIKKGISIYEAAKIEKYQPGTKVTFSDRYGNVHVGIVEKPMTKRIRIFDKTTKSVVNVYPNLLRDYVAKSGTPRQGKVSTGDVLTKEKRKYVFKTEAEKNAPQKPKRKYVFKTDAQKIVAPVAKRKYVFKTEAQKKAVPTVKRKYVFKTEAQKSVQPIEKRKYVRTATAGVDLSPLFKKYAKESNMKTQTFQTRRKYVRKAVTQ